MHEERIKRGQSMAAGLLSAIGYDEIPYVSDEDYGAQEKINAHYSEGENFHEPERGEHDAQAASDCIDAQERG